MNIIRNKVVKSAALCLLLISMSAQAINFVGLRNVFTTAGKTLANTKVWQKFATLGKGGVPGKIVKTGLPITALILFKHYVRSKGGPVGKAAYSVLSLAGAILLMRYMQHLSYKKRFMISIAQMLLDFLIIECLQRIAYKKHRNCIFSNPNISDFEKLQTAIVKKCCRLTEEILDNLEDINMHFSDEISILSEGKKHHYNGNEKTPLHLLARGCLFEDADNGAEHLVMSMVEKKFANVKAVNSFGKTPMEGFFYIGSSRTKSRINKRIKEYLQHKEYQHTNVIERVATLKDDLNNGLDLDNAPKRFEDIKNLIENNEIPGYAKMLVLPELVGIYKTHRGLNICTLDDIKDLYKHIVFNKPFLNEQQFRVAVEFALEENIEDMNGKTVGEMSLAYGLDSDFQKKMVASFFYKQEGLCKDVNVVKDWLAKRPNPSGGIFANLFSRVKGVGIRMKNKLFASKSKKLYLSTLDKAKEDDDKKKFRDLANASIVMNDLKRFKIPNQAIALEGKPAVLPSEMAGKIMAYAGTDFGNKINFR